MKIAVVGAGAIGGYLGAKLSMAGEDVTFIARNRNLAAIQANGFKLILEDGTQVHAPNVRAVQTPAQAGPQDAVLLTVKAHQVADLLPDLRGLFGPQTMVVTMINGVPWWYFQRLGGAWDGQRRPGGHRRQRHHRPPGAPVVRGVPAGCRAGRRQGRRRQHQDTHEHASSLSPSLFSPSSPRASP